MIVGLGSVGKLAKKSSLMCGAIGIIPKPALANSESAFSVYGLIFKLVLQSMCLLELIYEDNN